VAARRGLAPFFSNLLDEEYRRASLLMQALLRILAFRFSAEIEVERSLIRRKGTPP
jgi:hypothetical protein